MNELTAAAIAFGVTIICVFAVVGGAVRAFCWASGVC